MAKQHRDRGRGDDGRAAPRRLTKRFFMGLDEGLFLTSNVVNSELYPCFAQYVTKRGAAREMQWEAIKLARVDQRNCHVFRDQKEFADFLGRVDLG